MALGGQIPGMSPRTGEKGTPELTEDDMNEARSGYAKWRMEVEQRLGEEASGAGPNYWIELFQMGYEPQEAVAEYLQASAAGEPLTAINEPEEEGVDRYRDGEPVEPGHQRQDEARDPGQMTEFDKFMDRIVIDERHQQRVNPQQENNPQRQRAARHQDRPMNKTRWGGRRG